MNMFAISQALILTLVLSFSVWKLLRRVSPRVTTRCQAGLSMWLNRPSRAGCLRAVGRWMQPKEAAGSCGDGCGTCGGCDDKLPTRGAGGVMPLTFRASKKN